MKTCPDCGKRFSEMEFTCTRCGAGLRDTHRREPEESILIKYRLRFVAAAVLLLFVAACVLSPRFRLILLFFNLWIRAAWPAFLLLIIGLAIRYRLGRR